jgi:hypothetical protein
MDIKMVDVTVHIDESVDHAARERIADSVRALEGVVAAVTHDERPHLMVIEYNPDKVTSQQILSRVKSAGVHAELVGL